LFLTGYVLYFRAERLILLDLNKPKVADDQIFPEATKKPGYLSVFQFLISIPKIHKTGTELLSWLLKLKWHLCYNQSEWTPLKMIKGMHQN